MVLGGCLNMNQAYRAISWRSVVLISAMIPMSVALQVNGGADTTVPHDGSVSPPAYYYASTVAITKRWTGGATCASQPEPWTSPVIPAGEATCAVACGDTPTPAIDCLWPENIPTRSRSLVPGRWWDLFGSR